MKLKIIGPGGQELLNSTSKIKKLQIRHMRYAGKRRRKTLWNTGEYTGIGELIRKSEGKTFSFPFGILLKSQPTGITLTPDDSNTA